MSQLRSWVNAPSLNRFSGLWLLNATELLARCERWTPSFGQPASGVKVGSMRLVRLLTVLFFWLYPCKGWRYRTGFSVSTGVWLYKDGHGQRL